MIGPLTTSKTLTEARRMQARIHWNAGQCALAWKTLVSLLAAGALDMLLPWPAWLRGLFLLGLLAGVFVGLWRLRGQAMREHTREEQIARAIETQRPELDNALIHAVQFAPALALHSDDPSAPLMRQELERAERAIAQLPLAQVVARAPLQRERRRLLIVGILLVGLLMFPRAWRFEIPRFFAFWADHPPFTLTDFALDPTNARLRTGDSLNITVRVGGLLPSRLELVTGRAGEAAQTLALTEAEPGVYTATLENLTRDTWFYANANTGRSAKGWANIDAAPHLRRLTAAYHPPAYARRPDATTELRLPAEIQGLAGTQVTLDIEADQPIGRGEIVVNRDGMAPQSLRLTPSSAAPTHATAAFTLERAGDFHLALTGADSQGGLRTPDAATGKITLQRDETPLVAITLPGQNVLATPDQVVPLHVEAEDDIAVQRLELHRIINRGQDTAQAIPTTGSPHQFTYSDHIDLKSLHAKPGDVIEYYATAYDNDPGGIHNTDSDRYWVWVVSRQDYQKTLAKQRGPAQMIAQYRTQVDALANLADAQRALSRDMAANANAARKIPPGDAAAQARQKAQTESLRQRQRDLQNQAHDLAQQMQELANQPPQYDIERGLQSKLAQLARAVTRAQPPMQTASRALRSAQMAASSEQAARALEQARQTAGANIARAVNTLEKTQALYQDFAHLQELAQEQTRLAQQAAQIKQSGQNDAFAQSRLKSLADQQAQNRASLDQIRQDLESHAQVARSESPHAARTAQQLAQAIGAQNISQTMQGAQQALEHQNISEGAAQAETARRALESLLGQGQQGQQQCNGSCNSQSQSQLGQGAGRSLAQMSRGLGKSSSGSSSGEGNGQSMASGGQPSGYNPPKPGSRPGDQPGNDPGESGQQATAMTLATQASGGKPGKTNNGGPRAERVNDLSNDVREKTPAPATRAASKATDREESHYPSEYRRLVRDYFKSVANGNRSR